MRRSRVERGGEDRQAVEQRGDVGQRGRLCRRLSGEDHEPLAPLGDGVFEFRHAVADAAAQRRSDVVGFEVDELAGEAPLEVGDLCFDLVGALVCRCGPLWFGRGVDTGAPVAGALFAEEGGGEEGKQRRVEALLVQVHVRRVVGGDVLRALVGRLAQVVRGAPPVVPPHA
ncbi:MAG: hypothetical protein ACRDY0_04275 [Acidimicrobiales bacterium]